ncbi:hypothetical protein DFH07DRAFT_289809 [Mycena maculata]|uniref:Uncharacterized protein n=1 Tax=Mycena maculata TaxID=230809 RepID=A0AAD7NP31_9AGAR|nr:hypothetical protein DFH07DRAFT_289809 [Mycena maculata]
MLSSAPNLVDCTFRNVYFEADLPPISPVTHSSLKCLSLYGYPLLKEPLYSSSTNILWHLTLPALEHLSIGCEEITRDDLCAFLARSSPPLKSLYIYSGNDFADVEHFLQFIPTVTDLYLWEEDFAFSVINAIGSHCLPKLRNLMIYGNMYPANRPYEQLFSALSARHASGAPLQSLRILWDPSYAREDSKLYQDMITGMRKLAADGMEIRACTKTRNFI